ncbi:MAG: hypothetical protein JNK07_18765 [Alphaproteobacteria bacterium]|nr:hypothetical protein [Alphaproteobacteria bacterium]
MSTLYVSPDAPVWMHVGAQALLVAHVGGGTLGMMSGAVAIVARKGEWLHRAAGKVFFVSMLAMAAVGAGVAPFLSDGQRVNTVAGIMTLYMVATAWAAARRERIEVGYFDIAGFVIAVLVAAAGAVFAIQASQSPTGTIDDSPPQSFYMFMTIGTIAALSDLSVILRGGLSGAQRIARHLWRMCVALFIATGSFFLGQQKFLPEFMVGTPLQFAPVLLPIAVLAFWLLRVLLTRWYDAGAPTPALATK